MEGSPEITTGGGTDFPKPAAYKLEADFPDPGFQQSTPEKDVSEAAPSNSEIIPCSRLGLGQWQACKLWSRQKEVGKEGKEQLGHSVLSSDDKPRNKGRSLRCARGMRISLLRFQSQSVLFVLAAVPDKRPVFLLRKYASTLITIAYETNIYKAARLHANGLEIPWRVLQK